MNRKEITKKINEWIKASVKDVLAHLNGNCSTYTFPLDDENQLAIGWSDGFDIDSKSYITDPEDVKDSIAKHRRTCYALCIKVCERINDSYEYISMPWNTEKAEELDPNCVVGDVYDTDIGLHIARGYSQLAKMMYDSYLDIRKGLDNGTLTY